ncbi:MAG TPA: SAM-dependent chlorinase/fluorinase, partial [Bryobacteraceae bacterium]|nr:SAM-dependent chlorinase/fluorinase [Bryobacteraceae bacterium]
LVEAEGHYFIGPDNGVLAMVYSETRHDARHITSDEYFLKPVSRTFHGRDIFAPVAAHLAEGVESAAFGPIIDDHLKVVFDHPAQTGDRTWSGTILHADRFGNLVTNFHMRKFGEVELSPFELCIGSQRLHRIALNYADTDPGELFLIVGSSGYLEVAANQASAAKLLGCGPGAPCDLTFS